MSDRLGVITRDEQDRLARAWREGYEECYRSQDVELTRETLRAVREERDSLRQQHQGAVARADAAEGELRQFQAGLTDALRAHNVPAMPRWADAIHWLARHGGQPS